MTGHHRQRPEVTVSSHRARTGEFLRSRTVRQAGLNAFSTGLTSLLAAAATALVARHLTADSFGTYQFAVSFLLFAAIFFEFGLGLPAARIAARSSPEDRPAVIGAALTVFGPVCLSFAVAVLALSFATDSVFNVDAGSALRATAALAIVYPFQFLSLQLASGADRLHVYSVTSALSNAMFVAALAVVGLRDGNLTIETALWLRAGGLGIGSLLFVLWVGPRALALRSRIGELLRESRDYGFAIYLGRLLSTGTYNMDVLMLGALADARAVGLYALAGALARVSLLPVIGATSALFPRMVHQPKIDPRALQLAGAAGIVGVLVLGLAGSELIDLIFSSRYHEATRYLVPLALAEACRGVTLVYNTHLSAHAEGRALRNAGAILTGSNLVLNFALIPEFGASGAAWASFAALVINLVAHIVYYRGVLRRVTGKERPGDAGPSEGTLC